MQMRWAYTCASATFMSAIGSAWNVAADQVVSAAGGRDDGKRPCSKRRPLGSPSASSTRRTDRFAEAPTCSENSEVPPLPSGKSLEFEADGGSGD